MTIIRVQLDDEDRKRYGSDEPLPEDLAFDTEWLKDLPAGQLDTIERETGLYLAALLPLVEGNRIEPISAIRRAVAYLAVRQAGHHPQWENFQPRLLRATFTQEDDANPPDGPSESSSGD